MSGGTRLALWPAIDLKGGRVVRLMQGDWDRTTVFEGDPAEIAKNFEDEGADGIHVVDLDAAFGRKNDEDKNEDKKNENDSKNEKEIEKILRMVSIPVQVGGGVRTEERIQIFLERGVSRVVLGTLALAERGRFINLLRNPRSVSPRSLDPLSKPRSSSSSSFPSSRIVVALDCREGRPMVRGWTEDAGAGDAVSVAREMSLLGVSSLLVTDISRDGALSGPNLELLSSVRSVFPGEILASGGMRGEEDLEGVDRALAGGPRGAIFGRALHAGATTVARLKAARDRMASTVASASPMSPAGRMT